MCSQDNEKPKRRAGGEKMEKIKRSGDFHMRASERWLDQLDAASKALSLGKTALVERALAAFCPSYFATEDRDDSSSGHCAKYAPQLFDERREEKSSDRSGGQAVPKAKRRGADRQGPSEKN